MTLVLRGLSLNDALLSNPLVGRFDVRGGEIGRSDSATFTLPDPERLISRVHAKISHSDNAYWIENVSAAGPILHNSRPLSSGMRVSLRADDELRIGGYRVSVTFESDGPARSQPTSSLPDRAAPAARAVAAAAVVAVAPAAASASVATAEAARPTAAASRGVRPALMRPTSESAVDGEALWRGFQDGVSVDLPVPNGPSPELFSAIGAMLKIAVSGIHRLIGMRAVAKNAMHADLTMIQMRGNNPLKFVPEASAALRMLLQPPMQGFMSGPAALRDAMIDLQSHQVGVMAGMRAALAAVLERFDPVRLETQLGSRPFLDALMPAYRRAKLWELYVEQSIALKDEAQNDFGRLFGDAFLEAYTAQVKKLEGTPDEMSVPAALRAGAPY